MTDTPLPWPAAPFRTEAEIARLGQGLLDRTLPKSAWTHAGHLAATVWLLRARPDIDAGAALPRLIRALNDSHGVPNSDTRGYHETITRFFLRALPPFLDGLPPGTPLHQAVNALLDSPLGRGKATLLAYWSEAVLFSSVARRDWVPPDRAPLPW